ncbi:hypothetical protein C9374_008346 [Naegleria lovaniensis]|uniref:Uncharacterized protein n=1 Tax=Naegleria lovaniensis TaxID=51637 RepID=A0AA88GL77_NAELO|nr:uncharacterized protein C9374_008346 [Naegleria lovaniensis]KAG2378203.1 hypothetical protein C9374_008346 [Naegleria lovaniensis]
MGLLEDSTPKVEKSMGMIILIINFLFPGFGTILAAILTSEKEKMTSTLIVGILQMFLSWLLIGWLWAIWWGYKIMQVSNA